MSANKGDSLFPITPALSKIQNIFLGLKHNCRNILDFQHISLKQFETSKMPLRLKEISDTLLYNMKTVTYTFHRFFKTASFFRILLT